jgi:predicted enzyme related to lactoylglutathione lyase
MGAKAVHFEIIGKDGEGLKKFFGELFDWKIDSNNPINYGIIKGEEGGIGGGIGSVMQEGESSHATFFVEVDNVQASLDKIVELGGSVVVSETVIPDMVTFGLFKDPEGNLVGLVKSE